MQSYQKILYQLNNTLENLTAEVAALRQQPQPTAATPTAAPAAPFSPEAVMGTLVKLRASLDNMSDRGEDGSMSTEYAAMQDAYDLLLCVLPTKRVSFETFVDVPAGLEDAAKHEIHEYVHNWLRDGTFIETLTVTDGEPGVYAEYFEDKLQEHLRAEATKPNHKNASEA